MFSKSLAPRNNWGLAFRLVVFATPLVLGLLVIEWRLSLIPNSYAIKDQGASQAMGTEALVLGSSHALKGINPALMTLPTYNLANVSQTLKFDQALLEVYTRNMPKLRWVVVPISYFSLYEDLEQADPIRAYFYARYHHFKPESVSYLSLPMVSYIALYGSRLSIRMVLNPAITEAKGLAADGFQSMPAAASFDLTPANASQRIKEHHRAMSMANLSGNIVALESIRQYCQAKGIGLLLVRLPVHDHYRALEQETYRHKTDSIIQTLNAGHKVPFLDLDGSPLMADQMFSDVDHLSAAGAQSVTHEINQALLRLDSKSNR